MNRQTSSDKEITDVDMYTFQLPQPQQEIVQHLRAFITGQYPELTETLKWHVTFQSINDIDVSPLEALIEQSIAIAQIKVK